MHDLEPHRSERPPHSRGRRRAVGAALVLLGLAVLIVVVVEASRPEVRDAPVPPASSASDEAPSGDARESERDDPTSPGAEAQAPTMDDGADIDDPLTDAIVDLAPATTGWRGAGLSETDLQPVEGGVTSQDGQVIENVDVNGNIQVAHRNVTIRNCRIQFNSGYGISVVADANVDRVTVEHCEIRGTSDDARMAILGTGAQFTVRRNHIHETQSGLHFSDGAVIEHNYVHSMRVFSGSHNTGMASHGGTGMVVRNNRIESSTSAALSLYPRLAPISDVIVEGNLFEGTDLGIGLYAGYSHEQAGFRDRNSHIRIVDNRWTGSFQHGTHLSWNPDQPGNRWTGNRWLGGGPID